jgi:hypothetical protein
MKRNSEILENNQIKLQEAGTLLVKNVLSHNRGRVLRVMQLKVGPFPLLK